MFHGSRLPQHPDLTVRGKEQVEVERPVLQLDESFSSSYLLRFPRG